jgi:hypothetical protein
VVSLVTLFLRLPSAKQYMISTYIVEKILGQKITNPIIYPWNFPNTSLTFDAQTVSMKDIQYLLCFLKLLAANYYDGLSENITRVLLWSKLKINIQLEPIKPLSWTLNADEFKEYRTILLKKKKYYEEKRLMIF